MEVLATERLLASDEPSIRYRTLVDVLGGDPSSSDAVRARAEIRTCPRVRRLLDRRDAGGRLPGHVYAKWSGAHWVLAALAELGYPPGDPELLPLRDQVYDCWLSPGHTREFEASTKAGAYRERGVPVIEGRARRCGSQEGYALWSTLRLGNADERANRLAANLIRWQWPDGGWNCDRRPEAATSSFHESHLPLRALALHARLTGNAASGAAARRAAELFLTRRLFRRLRDGEVIHPSFTRLHYPAYWRYDLLGGLRAIAEAGLLGDPRCREALDLLESKRLADGGFPAEGRFYRVVVEPANGGSLVDWGGTSKVRMNEWVTVEALSMLCSSRKVAAA
jgi:hypothetical protein